MVVNVGSLVLFISLETNKLLSSVFPRSILLSDVSDIFYIKYAILLIILGNIFIYVY